MALVPGPLGPRRARQVAHYGAGDALPLTSLEIEYIGAEVAGRIITRSIGVIREDFSARGRRDTWTVFAHSKKLRDLTWRGGDVAVTKLGPKEASLRVGRHSVRELSLLQDELRRLSTRARGARESQGLRTTARQVLLGADARLPDVVGLNGAIAWRERRRTIRQART